MGLGAAWGLLAGVWVWSATRTRRLPAVQHHIGARTRARRGPVVGAQPGNLLAALGRSVSRLAAPFTRTPGPIDPHIDRTLGLALLGGFILAAGLHPVLGLLVVAAALVAPRLRARNQARRTTTAVVDQLPDVIDLLRLTTLAGLPVSAAIVAIGRRPGGVVGDGLQGAAHNLRHGATTVEALGALATACGPPARSLVDALVDHDRYGTPLTPVLDRLAVEYRLRRRQQAEEAARRLPVTLLFPLVLTTLPACALLTIVPLLVASFSSLQV